MPFAGCSPHVRVFGAGAAEESAAVAGLVEAGGQVREEKAQRR